MGQQALDWAESGVWGDGVAEAMYACSQDQRFSQRTRHRAWRLAKPRAQVPFEGATSGIMCVVAYSLVFWQHEPQKKSLLRRTPPNPDPEAIYHALQEGHQVVGLAALPIEEILASLIQEFPGSSREPNGTVEWVVWDGGGSGLFEATWSAQHLNVDCRNMSDQDMNRVMDVAGAYGLPLYDPRVGERFAFGGH